MNPIYGILDMSYKNIVIGEIGEFLSSFNCSIISAVIEKTMITMDNNK